MFYLSQKEISIPTFDNHSAGAFIHFEGRIRNHNKGKGVIQLEYEVFEALALKEGNRILQEAKEHFDILEILAIHRTGSLQIGELAVWIGVTAKHRDTAFLACRYTIDQIKKRVPIWKKETYTDGMESWVNCCLQTNQQYIRKEDNKAVSIQKNILSTSIYLDVRRGEHKNFSNSSVLSKDEQIYYSQQIALPEIGLKGQEALKRSSILVIGCGGLGSSALIYLARAGIGKLGICEFDAVEMHNLPRQILYDTSNSEKLKIKIAKTRIRQENPWVQVVGHPELFGQENAQTLFSQYDLILDCTDHGDSHLLASLTAVQTRKVLIQASIYQYEGQLSVYHPNYDSPCLCDLWNRSHATETCLEHGVLNTTPGIFGMLQATEAIKSSLKIPSPLYNHVLLMDLLNYQQYKIKRFKNHGCLFCCKKYQTSNPEQKEKSISPPTVYLSTLEELKKYHVIFMKPDTPETGFSQFIQDWQSWDENWQPERMEQNYLLICLFGKRSLHIATLLRKQGFANVFSLHGGKIALNALLSKTEGILT